MNFFENMRLHILERIKDWKGNYKIPERDHIGLSVTDAQLLSARDLLLPGLRAEGGKHPDLELDIFIDFSIKCLLVKGFNKKNKQTLGFAITAGQIKDGLYKGPFRPNVLKLIELLNQAEEPVECA